MCHEHFGADRAELADLHTLAWKRLLRARRPDGASRRHANLLLGNLLEYTSLI